MKKLLLILPFLLLINCDKKELELTQEELLVGEWTQPFGVENDILVLEYLNNGMYQVGIERDGFYFFQRQGTYSVNLDVISYNNAMDVTFLVDGDTLYLNNSEYTRR